MARGRADIANTALRIFLQEMGKAYDEERGLQPYNKAKHFQTVREFFEDRCCYCGTDLASGANQDHLIPMNKTNLGLDAWGNIVPACQACNAKKQGGDWRDFIIQRAGPDAAERHAKMNAFLAKYDYKPSRDLRATAEELYEEVGSIAMTLINVKVKRAQL
jgi:hypothetical protein